MLNQTKTFTASEAKNNFGSVINLVKKGKVSDVIIENRGKPVVAIIKIEDRNELEELRAIKKRKEALFLLKKARAGVQARIRGKLAEDQAGEIANRFSHEIIEDLEKEGKIVFEREST